MIDLDWHKTGISVGSHGISGDSSGCFPLRAASVVSESGANVSSEYRMRMAALKFPVSTCDCCVRRDLMTFGWFVIYAISRYG